MNAAKESETLSAAALPLCEVADSGRGGGLVRATPVGQLRAPSIARAGEFIQTGQPEPVYNVTRRRTDASPNMGPLSVKAALFRVSTLGVRVGKSEFNGGTASKRVSAPAKWRPPKAFGSHCVPRDRSYRCRSSGRIWIATAILRTIPVFQGSLNLSASKRPPYRLQLTSRVRTGPGFLSTTPSSSPAPCVRWSSDQTIPKIRQQSNEERKTIK